MGTTATKTGTDAFTAITTNLKDLRKQAKMTQAELAEAAGCSTATIVNIELLKGVPRKATVNGIAAALRGADVSL